MKRSLLPMQQLPYFQTLANGCSRSSNSPHDASNNRLKPFPYHNSILFPIAKVEIYSFYSITQITEELTQVTEITSCSINVNQGFSVKSARISVKMVM